MSERMIPGGILRSDARGSANGRRFIQERLLMGFLNTGMWVAGEKISIRPHACVLLHRSKVEDAKPMTKTRFKRKGGFYRG